MKEFSALLIISHDPPVSKWERLTALNGKEARKQLRGKLVTMIIDSDTSRMVK